ncbi:hypothetical protein QBC35DRAFT_426673 [Podospora australis]|uniref:Uncharacterized protein n=1 Tax=Podospora australis TaxID=1536484 RepID=A0AAN6WZU3_9PEZI|nr:hypothetical protein QBC35DRAFT_426673 [Podospora australis]
MQPGLSQSRHAPWNQPRPAAAIGSPPSSSHNSNSYNNRPPPPPLTVTPAPTGNSTPYLPPLPRAPSNSSSSNSPRPPQEAPAIISAAHELGRFRKIMRRLEWKSPFLDQGYQHAIDRVGQHPDAVAEAELMFKLDFFEYYMLIERALVHLLGVFGLSIERGATKTPSPVTSSARGLGASGWNNSDGSNRFRGHRYHANVLKALDRRDNPLHETLGMGEVRKQLGRAKDLRNRWKTAGDDEEEQGRARTRPGAFKLTKKIPAPLETYDLANMLQAIFEGFQAAAEVAERAVRGGLTMASGQELDMDMLDSDETMGEWAAAIHQEDDKWEFMVDAMDWEAV